MNNLDNIKVKYIETSALKPADYNPRQWDATAVANLKKSMAKFGLIDPIIVNIAPGRLNTVIGGNFRLKIAKDLKYKKVPVVYVNIPDIEKEKELNIRLNKNLGEWDFDLLSKFDENFLDDIGFSSVELDNVFDIDENPEMFDLKKELKKLKIDKIKIKKGDVYQLGNSKLMCGDSTREEDIKKLMGMEKADMCLTDPPYILNYLQGKQRHGKATTGFGAKKNRRYLETDILPPDFTEKWMANIHRIAREEFSIIVYENWKNIRTIWNELEKYWKIKNMIVWHLPNRNQGFAAKYKFFSKHDIAMVGSSEKNKLNIKPEEELLQNEYETALYAISGHPQWEGYEKGKKIQPTDHIEYPAADEKSSGQAIIFGTKPVEILIPYIKVLTKRNDLIIEPFSGSGSTLIAATKMKRCCYGMEKSPIYAEVIRHRWEKFTGLKAQKIL